MSTRPASRPALRIATLALAGYLCSGAIVTLERVAARRSITVRRSLVREARAAIGTPSFDAAGGRDGVGVVIAVIDTGFDVRHRSLRGRARWVLDQSMAPRGAHSDLERRFRGAVWGGDELERAIDAEASRPSADPSITTDVVGHGTFVASVAAGGAGGGASEGVAPGAELLLAKVGSAAGITDESIIDAMDFAIDRAGDRPLVVVLAAGSVDGAHDGTSAIERAIDARFVPENPGDSRARRALVVAAGNEGGAGVRRRARVERTDGAVALGVFVDGALMVSRTFAVVHEGPLELAIEGPLSDGQRAARTRWVAQGEHYGASVAGFRVGVDRTGGPGPGRSLGESLREGVAARTTLVTIVRESSGDALARASAWRLLARGDAVFDVYGVSGAVAIEDGGDDGTLVVPATAEGAIVVGALVTRERWEGPGGLTRERPVPRSGDGVAAFSSRGPDRVHRARPDLVAPGAWVLGARSLQCDQRAPGSLCAESVAADDPRETAAMGTSVAAPIAAGALARVWSTSPMLSRDAALSRLTRTSDRWTSARRWGAVDLRAALSPGERIATRCSLVASVDAVAPGEPLSFALRATGERGAIDGAPSVTARLEGASLRWVRAYEGGRAELRVRVADAAVESVSVRATLEGGASCEARAAVRRHGRARPASCAVESVGSHSNGVVFVLLIALAIVATRGGRPRSRRACPGSG
jgi:subtilisin family serine protease